MESGPVTLVAAPTTTNSSSKESETSGDEVILTEEAIRKMNVDELLQLCKDNNIEITSDMVINGTTGLVDFLINEFGE